MNNQARALAAAVTIAMLLAAAGWASAADPAPSKQPRRSAPLVSAHAVAIRNDAGQPMSFYLSGCDKPGKAWPIKDRAMEEFPCRGGCDICVFTSQDVRVSYTLQERSRYRIYWNDERDRWDVSALSSAAGDK
jgi:hypothetical protein